MRRLTCFVAFLIFFGCEENEIQPGYISLHVLLENEVVSTGKTKTVIPDDWDVTIFNVNNSIVAHWDNYLDVPDSVRLEPGSYFVNVSSQTITLPAFDASIYAGTSGIFTIADNVKKAIDVNCALSNVKLSVEFTNNVKVDFVDYYVRVTDASTRFLTFDKNEVRPGFFAQGDLTVYIKLTYIDVDGSTKFLEKTKIIEDTNNNDYHKLRIDGNVNIGSAAFSVDVDDLNVIETTITLGDSAPDEGVLVDLRDGKQYTTTLIGTQLWMAENLSFDSPTGDFFYDNNSANEQLYGRLYNYETAKLVCPTGWHLPSGAEWDALRAATGDMTSGGNLKENTLNYWAAPNTGATDLYGFRALPAGFKSGDNYHGLTTYASFWSSSSNASTAFYVYIPHNNTFMVPAFDAWKDDRSAHAVRCIKD